MSFNRVFPHTDERYVEAVIDGHEDWQSAIQIVEDMLACADDHGLNRILFDFTTVDMRVAVKEAPDIARMFDTFAPAKMSVAIISPPDSRGASPVEVFAAQLKAFGHTVSFILSASERQDWISDLKPLSKTG